jgi:uncharacterized protein YegP (UPF0339 family)
MSRFHLFQDRARRWRWTLVSRNRKKVASSGESFASPYNAWRAAAGVQAHAPDAILPPAPRAVRRRRAA